MSVFIEELQRQKGSGDVDLTRAGMKRRRAQPESDQDEKQFNEDIFTMMCSALPVDYPDRLNIAALAAYVAAMGDNPSRIAKAIGRSSRWVSERMKVVNGLLSGCGHLVQFAYFEDVDA